MSAERLRLPGRRMRRWARGRAIQGEPRGAPGSWAIPRRGPEGSSLWRDGVQSYLASGAEWFIRSAADRTRESRRVVLQARRGRRRRCLRVADRGSRPDSSVYRPTADDGHQPDAIGRHSLDHPPEHPPLPRSLLVMTLRQGYRATCREQSAPVRVTAGMVRQHIPFPIARLVRRPPDHDRADLRDPAPCSRRPWPKRPRAAVLDWPHATPTSETTNRPR